MLAWLESKSGHWPSHGLSPSTQGMISTLSQAGIPPSKARWLPAPHDSRVLFLETQLKHREFSVLMAFPTPPDLCSRVGQDKATSSPVSVFSEMWCIGHQVTGLPEASNSPYKKCSCRAGQVVGSWKELLRSRAVKLGKEGDMQTSILWASRQSLSAPGRSCSVWFLDDVHMSEQPFCFRLWNERMWLFGSANLNYF